MRIRTGVKWTDGTALTPADVAYSFNLLKIPTHPQHPLWTDTALKHVAVRGNTVVFTFGLNPGYQEFDFYRFNVVVVPQHVFKGYSNTELTTGNLQNPKKLVGTGPYVYQSGIGAASNTVVWKKNPNWWAAKQLGLNVGPQYVVDIKNGTNAAALSNLLAGNIDLFNNFAPKSAIKGEFKTFIPKAPYHLGANTTWLFPNTTKKPLNDPKFRRALAESINMGQIIDKAYQGLVEPGEPDRPPADLEQVDRQEGRQAERVLVQPRQGQGDSRGRRVQGHERRRVRREQGRVGDRSQDRRPERMVRLDDRDPGHLRQREGGRDQDHAWFPEYSTLVDDRGHGRYDLLLGNDRQITNTPWTYYQYIYKLPIVDNQTTMNYQRFTDQAAFNLTQELNNTPSSNTRRTRRS